MTPSRMRWNRRVRAVPLAVLLVVPGAACGRPTDGPEPSNKTELLARSLEMIRRGEASAARELLEPALERAPDWTEARLRLALAYHDQRQWQIAADHFQRVLDEDPALDEARLPYGWCLYYLGRLDQARAMFESFLVARPDYVDAVIALGLIDFDDDDVASARSRFEKAVAIAGTLGDVQREALARSRLADVLQRTGELEQARKHLEQSIRLDPDNTKARFKLTHVLALIGGTTAASAGPRNAQGARHRLRFVDATLDSGIALRMTSGKVPAREILEVNGGGVALLDYDRDGDFDLFFANGATMDDTERGPGSRLYRNRGDGTFDDATREAGIDLPRWAMGVAVGDYDADGFDDLYVTCFGPNVLLRNAAGDGGRRFVDVSAAAGVDDPGWGTSAAFGDLDGDGDLDLYVANYLEFDVDSPPARRSFKGVEVFGGPMGLVAPPDVLYENLGNGRFRDATAQSGCVPDRPGFGLGVVIADVDGDGDQDIVVGNDSTENFLCRNLGRGRFEEVGVVSGIASNYDGRNQATMGIAVGDVDGNGLPDLFTTNFSSDVNTLHLNLGALFDDRTSQFGLAGVSRPFLSWGSGFYDFDSDGDEDLFIASGHIYAEVTEHEMDTDYEQPLLLFERVGTRFERATEAGAIFEGRYSGRSTAFGDLDGDGDVDIVMVALNDRVRIFRNESPRVPVVNVELRGRAGNRNALGAMIELISGQQIQRRWIHGGSYQSVDAPAAYFGLGRRDADEPLTLRVRWPDGETAEYRDVPADRRITVIQGNAPLTVTGLRGRE